MLAFHPILGIDEAGRGPWAGPVVAAAVLLPADSRLWPPLGDSKALKPAARAAAAAMLQQVAVVGVGVSSAADIDALGIKEANRRAMLAAVAALLDQLPVYSTIKLFMNNYSEQQTAREHSDAQQQALSVSPVTILIDGRDGFTRSGFFAGLPAGQQVRADATEPAVMAASIIAKEHRDELMCRLDAEYPHYGFAVHKGYGTAAHAAALAAHGPCLVHRRSYAPIARLLAGGPQALPL